MTRPTEDYAERAWQLRALVLAGTAESTALTDAELVAYLMTLSGHDSVSIAVALELGRQRCQQLRAAAFAKVLQAAGLPNAGIEWQTIYHWRQRVTTPPVIHYRTREPRADDE